jgi:hypothetical protein
MFGCQWLVTIFDMILGPKVCESVLTVLVMSYLLS